MAEQQEFTQQMIDAGMHIGVRRFLVHPKMHRFVFTYKENLALINLEKTVELWDTLFHELKGLVAAGKTVLFLGTQPAAKKLLAECGAEAGFPFMTRRWLGGTLTNFSTFKARLDYLKELEGKMNSPEFAKYTKKEQGQMAEEANEIKGKFDGLTRLTALPDALFVFCGRRHRTAIMEAKRMNIPVLGVFGLDDNPDDATHSIVINDNAQTAFALVVEHVRAAYQTAKPAAAEAVTEPPRA